MKANNQKTTTGRFVLGSLTIAGVVACAAVFLSRDAYTDFSFVEKMTTSDTVQYVLASKYPTIRAEVLTNAGYKDIEALRARVDTDNQAVQAARKRVNRRLLVDCLTLGGSLAVFIMAGVSLLLPTLRRRQPSAEMLGA